MFKGSKNLDILIALYFFVCGYSGKVSISLGGGVLQISSDGDDQMGANPKKSLGSLTKPKKSLVQKLAPPPKKKKKIPCQLYDP